MATERKEEAALPQISSKRLLPLSLLLVDTESRTWNDLTFKVLHVNTELPHSPKGLERARTSFTKLHVFNFSNFHFPLSLRVEHRSIASLPSSCPQPLLPAA
jgi:hypothetical protein